MIAQQFTLYDQFGRPHALSDYRGRWVVLYFYPTGEGIHLENGEREVFEKAIALFTRENIAVLGVARDSVLSLFYHSRKMQLHMPILSDETEKVISAYKMDEVGGSGESVRKTFLIAPDGTVKRIYKDIMELISNSARIIGGVTVIPG